MSLPEPFSADHPFLAKDIFKDQVVLITGGGTGLGKAIGEAFARMGGSVAIASRDADHREAGLRAMRALGARAHGVAMDVRDSRSIAAAFDEFERELGPVSILINNAAGRFTSPAEDYTDNGWRAVTDIVMDGTFFCSREFHKRRCAAGQPGAIVNIGATYARTGGPGAAHSAAAKAAVHNLTQTLAIEWAVDGIRINTVDPGAFPHEDRAEHIRAMDQAQPDSPDPTIRMPAGRVGRLHELGWLITFLCSPFASYITGVNMAIDGGQWLRHRASSDAVFVPVREWARGEGFKAGKKTTSPPG
jgi:NAD(P)-dependent dehydrogenase (short-subunit alcohol dehydrogenase family)